MAEAAGCNKRAIIRIRSKLRLFGSIKAPPIKAGRPRSITPIMLEAFLEDPSSIGERFQRPG
jgi:hypothetical protein